MKKKIISCDKCRIVDRVGEGTEDRLGKESILFHCIIGCMCDSYNVFVALGSIGRNSARNLG